MRDARENRGNNNMETILVRPSFAVEDRRLDLPELIRGRIVTEPGAVATGSNTQLRTASLFNR